MSLSLIKESFYEAVLAASFTGDPDIYLANTEDSRLPSPAKSNHFRLFVLPSETRTVGVREIDQEVGFLQVSIFIEKGSNDLDGSDLAQEVLSLFPRNTELTLAGNTVARIDEAGSVNASFFENAFQITPVTIPYQNIC